MNNKMVSKSRWPRIRKFFNDVHLWLGLTSGLIVVAICLSGTLYVFNTEITENAAPHLYKVKNINSENRVPIDTLITKIQNGRSGKLSSILIPAAANRTYQFSFKDANDSVNRAGITYMVNPYNGEILGSSLDRNGARNFMNTMFSLHRWLLLDRVKKPIIKGVPNRELGSMITGWATIIFTLGCITGFIIWFPQKVRNWKQGLKIKWNAGWKRVNHDIHNSLAFYALFFLLLMGLTGPQWSFPWYREGLQKTLGTYKPPKAGGEKAKVTKDSTKLTDNMDAPRQVSMLLQSADSLLPYKGNYQLQFPADNESQVIITKTKTGFFAPAAGDKITMNRFTGAVVKLDIFREKPVNERIAGSIKAIHVGNVYGSFTKILYFLACLIATSLPVTGTMIWLNKMKKKPGKKNVTTTIPLEAAL